MTAGFFIANPSPAGPVAVATGLPSAGQGVAGAGGATGFEALLAAFFGNQIAGTATGQAALLSGKPGQAPTVAGAIVPGAGANDNADDPGKTADALTADAKAAEAKAPDAGQTISAEVQALAALMATPVAPPAGQVTAATGAKADGGTSVSAGAAFAAQKLLTPAMAKAQAAADQAASAPTANADIVATAQPAPADGAKDAAAATKLAANELVAPPATSGPTPTQAAKPVEAGTAPYAPPAPAKTEAASRPMPPTLDREPPEPPAAVAASQSAVEAVATANTATAPVKPKDLPPSHAADRVDTRTSADPPALDAAAASPVIRHPVTPVAPVGAKTGDAVDTGDKAPAEDVKLAKLDEASSTAQPAAAPAADHAAQTNSTATNAARATPETVASLAAQILRKADGRATRFDVELHPADLGRVDVRLEIGAEGRMTASMSFENPQAAAELRGRAHELQAALERAGFDVSGGLTFDVAGDRGQGGQNSGGQQQPDGGGATRGRAFQAALQSAGDTTAAAISGAFSGQGRTTSGVDIRI